MLMNCVEKVETVTGEKLIDMFCDMIEIVTSAHINESQSKILLESLPNDILKHFREGLTSLGNWTDGIMERRESDKS